MKLFQRFEVWLLVALSAGAAVWVLTQGAGEQQADARVEAAADFEQAGPAQAGEAVRVLRCTLERDFGNARLDIEIRYRNATPRDFTLQPPDVRLLTADGREVPPFVLPIERPPVVPAQSTQDVRLRYWLEKAHLAGGLVLDLRGERVAVKGSQPLDLDSLPNREPKTWAGTMP